MKKERFVVRYGNYLEFKDCSEISHFYAEDKTVYLVDNDNKRFTIDSNLTSLEKQLSESSFFRINRKYIVNLETIKRIKILPNRKMQLQLYIPTEHSVEVARERVPRFKEWIDS
ncbi:LytTr DNA-binding domain-containing protein [Spirosomataceae bacterium TFI 002]|nr:LytTr DNA-binding domain-containing protein [Spirosomataceae bacterium TFI 002]